MGKIRIAIINSSTVVKDDEVMRAMPALQKQISRDFVPHWGVDAELSFVHNNRQRAKAQWWLVIVDNSDQASVLGYHEMTSEGLPMGTVFAGRDKLVGAHWTVTASHELLEMLVDPAINLSAFVQTDANAGTFFAYEVCDPCQSESYAYEIDRVLVSNFLYPEWFESFLKGGTRFDHSGKIKAALELLPGGFISVLKIPSGLGWYQINGPPEKDKEARERSGLKEVAPVGSRRQRRDRTREQWMRSAPRAPRQGRLQ